VSRRASSPALSLLICSVTPAYSKLLKQHRLKIDALTTGPGATVRFGTVSTRTYTVEFTDALGSGPWQKLADVVARATNRVEMISDPDYTMKRFYRLVTPQSR
jgi:hypothetical protein